MPFKKQLEETISRLNKTQKIAKIGSWENDFLSGNTVFSDEACRIYGLPKENNIHKFDDWLSFIHPCDIEMVKTNFNEANKNNSNFNFYHRIITKQGAVLHIYSQIEYLFDDNGSPKGLYGIAHDITDLITIRSNLMQSETNIRLIMDIIPLSIYARDANGNYIFANHVFLKHYGITQKDLINKNLRDFVRSEEEYKELHRQDQLVLNSNERLIVSEFKQTDFEGVLKTWRIIKVPFTPKGHDKKAILGIAEDITDRKTYEDSLVNLTKSLSDRNKELELFSFMVSHDLRGPLATLMGIKDLIDNVRLDQEEIANFLGGTKSALTKLDLIIRDLNDIFEVRKNNKNL